MDSKTYTVAIAGSTDHTVICAEALRNDPRFTISWVLTPSPRLVGRNQLLTKNALHVWSEKHGIPTIFVEKSINEDVKILIKQQQSVDFLLVVDFGYLIPQWLLTIPHIAPVNIHPSDLPKYRGSSPGQFTLLFGEKKSAVSIIMMNEKLDEGDLIYQEKFDVLNTWITPEFYQFAFTLIGETLPNVLADFGSQKITATPQPLATPTPIARRLSREDGYIPWIILKPFMEGQNEQLEHIHAIDMSPLSKEAHATLPDWPQLIGNAVRALSPWPGVWTMVPTKNGLKRMKILSRQEVQLDGKDVSSYALTKKLITEI